eukprot:2359945-Prymnesium_polylepis.2
MVPAYLLEDGTERDRRNLSRSSPSIASGMRAQANDCLQLRFDQMSSSKPQHGEPSIFLIKRSSA